MQFNATQTPDALKAEIERRSYERDQRGFAVRDAAQAKTAEGVAKQKTTDDAAAATLLFQRREAKPPMTRTADVDGSATFQQSYDNGKTWQNAGDAFRVGGATKQDQDLASRQAERSYKALLVPSVGGEEVMQPPPSGWDRATSKMDITNWMATDKGSAYMTNVRNLIRSWVVVVEGKRMSDADAAANEVLKSFRFGSGPLADQQAADRLQGMALDIRAKGKLGGSGNTELTDAQVREAAQAGFRTEESARAYFQRKP